MKNKYYALVLASVAVLLLSGCADKISFQQAMVHETVGFWYGLWHGMIAPFAFIVSLFSDNTAVYAIYNNGGWYNFGYMFGIGGFSVSFCKRR